MVDHSLGSANRGALLIGTGTYEHADLQTLLSPEADCSQLAKVLCDPEVGDFQVQELVDADRATLERAIEEFFVSAQRDDVRLLYFSCHGVVSRSDKLYFAVRNTDPERPAHSSISAAFVHDLMDECRARSIVVVLDCCYSGLFIPGAKGDGSASFEKALAGHGRVVITAGTGMQRAWEGNQLDSKSPALSRFTGALVQGLSSGAADLNRDGLITLHELYKYVYESLQQEETGQTPRMGGEVQYEIVLAKVKKKRRRRSANGKARQSATTRPPAELDLPWRARAALGPAHQPVLAEGTVVVHEAYRLHVIDAVSRKRYPLIEMNYPGSPALHGGVAYFPGRDRWLQAADLKTGKPRIACQVRVLDGLLGISAGLLYAPSPDETLHAIDISTNEIRWSIHLRGLTISCPPEAAAGRLIFMTGQARSTSSATESNSDHIVALEERDEDWRYETDNRILPGWAINDKGIYTVQQERDTPAPRVITAINPINGKPIWSLKTTAAITTAPAAAEDLLIFGDAGNNLYALDALTGVKRWVKKTDGRLLIRPFAAADTLFTADRSANLTTWRLSSGRKLRSSNLLVSPDFRGFPALENRAIYVTDSRGDIHALPVGRI